MTYEHILYNVSGRVATLTLHRPEKRNALNAAMVVELQAALDTAGKDAAVKVIVLKGSGEAFCAGADLESLQQLQKNTREENLADSRALMALMKKIYYHDKVIIAQVEGHAIAGGCGLVTLCDLSYVVPEAKLGYTEVKIGFIPALVSVFLVRKIGEGRARELLLTGRLITAAEAAGYGLITQMVPAGEMAAHVSKVAEDLCNNASGNSLKVTKRLITRVYDLPLDEALEHAAAENAVTREHADCQRGIQAFLDRQKMTW